jgi:hypothetical protein
MSTNIMGTSHSIWSSAMVNLLVSHENVDGHRRHWESYEFTALHQVVYDGCLSIVNILLVKPDMHSNTKDG